MDNPSPGFDNKKHVKEGITFEGLDGKIDIMGGKLQNAV